MHDRCPRDDLPFKGKFEHPTESPQITIDRAHAHASSLPISGKPGNNLGIDLGDLRICEFREGQQACDSPGVKLEAAVLHMHSRIFEKSGCKLPQDRSFGRRRLGPGIEGVNLAQADCPTMLMFDFFCFGLDLRSC